MPGTDNNVLGIEVGTTQMGVVKKEVAISADHGGCQQACVRAVTVRNV